MDVKKMKNDLLISGSSTDLGDRQINVFWDLGHLHPLVEDLFFARSA